VLQQQEVIKSLQNVLQTNVSVCSSLGHPYLSQMVQMADSMLRVRGVATVVALRPGTCGVPWVAVCEPIAVQMYRWVP
jgi:hypothetical protein